MQADDSLSEFVAALPKCELHLHLEGSLRLPTVQRLAQRHRVDIGSDEHLRRQYQFRGFDEFLELFFIGLDVLRIGEDFVDAIDALSFELAAQNVRYAEVTTTAYSHFRRGVPMSDYCAALDEGRRRAAAHHDLELAWIIDIPREFEQPDECWTADFLASGGAPEGTVAIGLGGPEYGSDPRQYSESFARAKAVGFASVPHAGEMDGAHSVVGALDALHADRIGHGIRSVEDPELLRRLADTGTPLEISITSNLLLGACESYGDHPLHELAAAGVVVTLNTDDPAYFSTTLNDELLIAAQSFDFGRAGLVELQRTAVRVARMPAARKTALLQEIDGYPVEGLHT